MKTGMLENQTTLCEFQYQFIVLTITILYCSIYRYENGEEEHCLELWNRDGKVKIFQLKLLKSNVFDDFYNAVSVLFYDVITSMKKL